ncbi:zinc-dependent metalloprotease [Nocardioides sp. GY 10127]|uniref:zinc-dependent metalloprotease n=1 Tax=Nocardioides sp. GY 10127 TaxID=2569762 RepID=UPI0010A78F19|nr:zinc-dependent metalloprotease [Nocardioides sp. GY 10127]TIC84174.1 zinc-dependent metalloprotease [Nocardioides sp. GY 10127]
MSERPGDDETPNPFKGTPFEHLFGAGFGAGGGQGFDLSQMFGAAGGEGFDLSQVLGQIQSMMQPFDGPLNWELAVDTARKTVAQSPDPSPGSRQRDAVADTLRLADHWLDSATDMPSAITATAAWSRAEWVVGTADVWHTLVLPVAESSVGSVGNALPEEARAMSGPFIGMIGKAMGAMLAQQTGSGLGTLAGEVLSASDIGIPLTEPGRAAIVVANVEAFAEGLDVSYDDVLLYVALREAAHERLFANVPWLREHVLAAVTDYARGISINTAAIQERMEEQMRGADMSDPAALQRLMEEGMFEPPRSPGQEAALARLETALALVEGWVDEVVGQATEGRMPAAAKLRETMRRRRASGGPAEETFATLVGLELRPRRLRDASTLWGSLRTRQGTEGRDGVWTHPDLLPTAADLDDPLTFREAASQPEALTDAEFDAELAALLDGGLSGSAPEDVVDEDGDTGDDSGEGPVATP